MAVELRTVEKGGVARKKRAKSKYAYKLVLASDRWDLIRSWEKVREKLKQVNPFLPEKEFSIYLEDTLQVGAWKSLRWRVQPCVVRELQRGYVRSGIWGCRRYSLSCWHDLKFKQSTLGLSWWEGKIGCVRVWGITFKLFEKARDSLALFHKT